MRVLITGCRHWCGPDMAESVVARLIAKYGPAITIVHGAAKGIDQSFAEACRELGIKDEPHPADWDRYGKAAGPRRNSEMLAAGADMVVAFHRDLMRSRGTLDMVRQALAAGVPTYLCDDEAAVPRRVRGPI